MRSITHRSPFSADKGLIRAAAFLSARLDRASARENWDRSDLRVPSPRMAYAPLFLSSRRHPLSFRNRA